MNDVYRWTRKIQEGNDGDGGIAKYDCTVESGKMPDVFPAKWMAEKEISARDWLSYLKAWTEVNEAVKVAVVISECEKYTLYYLKSTDPLPDNEEVVVVEN